jgi:hypothetical protein
MMHTTKVLDVAAINRATVAMTNFPASGFACYYFSKTEKRSNFNNLNKKNMAAVHT